MQKIKQSNFELMRIISMFFIVLYHVIYHGQTLNNTNGTILLILQFIICITLVHVNSFILITGYFQYDKKFKLKKFMQIFTLAYFYKIIIYIIGICLKFATINYIDIFNTLNPFYIPYWYIACYLILYLLSPFLNTLIKNIDQKNHKNLILILILCFSFAPFFSNQAVGTNNGLTVIQFIIMYFIGAYLHKYPINQSKYFKNCSKNKIQLTLFVATIFFLFINFITYNFGTILENNPSYLLQYFGHLITENYIRYNFIFVILQSVCYFLWFSTLNIKSKFINYISSLTLGIYLIHEYYLIRGNIYYKWFNLDNPELLASKILIIKVIIVAIIIFVGCAIIDIIRQLIFKFIRKRKISQKISNKFYNYIDSLQKDA